MKIFYYLSLLFTALALAPAMALLLTYPNKIGLSGEEYLIVHQIYEGWDMVGIVVYVALFSVLGLVISVRKNRRAFWFALMAFLCIGGTQVIFWQYSYPVYLETYQWATLPENWQILREQWEYSHAASAGLFLLAMIFLIISAIVKIDEN